MPFAPAQLYAALPETHPAAHKERLVLRDLAKDKWILFPKRVHPLLYEAVMDTARRESIAPKHAHNVIAATAGSGPSIGPRRGRHPYATYGRERFMLTVWS